MVVLVSNAPQSSLDGAINPTRFSVDELRIKTRWIRDALEPNVARDGCRFLEPDTVLDLNQFLTQLASADITYEDLRESRIQKAILHISGKATRWPGKLIDLCDEIILSWQKMFGPLKDIRPLLYEPGGRLHKIIGVHENKKYEILDRFDREKPHLALSAHEWGHIGFKPGKWWINSLLAYHDGIIDSPSPGITFDDENGAYALLMTDYDETDGPSSERFTYRCRPHASGSFRLMNMFLPPKNPIRVLRSHSLHSVWSPETGVRYEGLYMIVGQHVRTLKGEMTFDLVFERQEDQYSMRKVLRRPNAEEMDDYIEYKRLRGIKFKEHRNASDRPIRDYDTAVDRANGLEFGRDASAVSWTDDSTSGTSAARESQNCDVYKIDDDADKGEASGLKTMRSSKSSDSAGLSERQALRFVSEDTLRRFNDNWDDMRAKIILLSTEDTADGGRRYSGLSLPSNSKNSSDSVESEAEELPKTPTSDTELASRINDAS